MYFNREVSWLQFNRRVLALATREDVPLLERVKFISIAASNLDEFYMVRIGGLERQRRDQQDPENADWLQRFRGITELARVVGQEIVHALTKVLIPELAKERIEFLIPAALHEKEHTQIRSYYDREVHACLTPVAVDPGHPFPLLRSGSLNIAFRLQRKGGSKRSQSTESAKEEELLAMVQVPSVLPRFVNLRSEKKRYTYIALEHVIAMSAGDLFPGHEIIEACPFRVTRASDLDIDEDEVHDLLSTIQKELRRRERGEPVRLELSKDSSNLLKTSLQERLGLSAHHVHEVAGFVAIKEVGSVLKHIDRPDLEDTPFSPVPSPVLRYSPQMFRILRERDVLLHHPYESFAHVVDFIDQAAMDPNVVAIKQTLYRTSGDSPIVRALARAAQRGKQVTALIEIKARFDEAANIAWAQSLEESGVHVVYGLIGLKTHCKILLVIRREGETLKRYVHLSTGNYNPATAKLYTDLGLFTSRDDITWDALLLFNVLTGYAELPKLSRLIVAPFSLRQHVLQGIEREANHAAKNRPAAIIAKMNSLVDKEIIEALYRASQQGVRIDLMIRGICCLRPGVPGVSDNIRVRSIIDRFLEHSRLYWWANGGSDELYLSSADWMPRNLNHRIEVSFPVLDSAIKARIMNELMPMEFSDNSFAWELTADGNYQPTPRTPESSNAPTEGHPTRAQTAFMALAKQRGLALRPSVRPEVSVAEAQSPALRAAQAEFRRRQPKKRRHSRREG